MMIFLYYSKFVIIQNVDATYGKPFLMNLTDNILIINKIAHLSIKTT